MLNTELVDPGVAGATYACFAIHLSRGLEPRTATALPLKVAIHDDVPYRSRPAAAHEGERVP